MTIEDLAKHLREQASFILFDEPARPVWELAGKSIRKAWMEHAELVVEMLQAKTEGAAP